ncbi:DUF4123 domain-containing protein, partial [Archangium sp.]|uniref:DUF4123 domain-containing protein n=1 Tax=Archangium sp. TaxID=1872627 RepID=UPI002D2385A2
FLFVHDQTGRELYLRFYDPRVLRELLPALSVSQATAFFEGMDSLLLEGGDARELIRFTWEEGRLLRERVEFQIEVDHDAP